MKQPIEDKRPGPSSAPRQRFAAPPAPSASDPPRTAQTIGIAAALGCFVLAFVMMGGACCLMLDWPGSLDLRSTSLAVCTLAAALAFVGFGVLCLLQRRNGGPSAFAAPPLRDPIEYKLDALDLTDKERAVARLILQHRSYRDIADLCRIAPRTVQFHATNVFRKADVHRRRDFEHLMLMTAPLPLEAVRGPLVSGPAPPSAPPDASRDDPATGSRIRRDHGLSAPTTTRSRFSQRQGDTVPSCLRPTKE